MTVGLFLRVHDLSTYWLNADEGIYYSTLTQPSFGAFWSEVMANAHPPAFYLLLRGMGYLTWDFVVLRWAPMLFGVAAIWAFWLVGRELAGPGVRGVAAGLVTATWMALSHEMVVLSQVLRPYSLVVLLLAVALFTVLRYRSRPERIVLVVYATALSLAVLTHYSAALGVGALSLVVAHDVLTRRSQGVVSRDLLMAHAVPVVLFVGLYLFHVSTALDSELMDQALGADGWLQDWLVDSPAKAWRSLVTFQSFHVPTFLRVRTVLLLLLAAAVSLLRREPTVALLVVGALGIALLASVLGLYPFGPSRHNAWLTVFTIPALGWLIAVLLVARRPRRIAAGVVVLAVVLVAGTPLESWGGPAFSSARGERIQRPGDLAPLVVERMEPDDPPPLVLMTEQTYYVLMPFFADERDDAAFTTDSTAFHFSYGSRRIVVVRTWDWSGIPEMTRWILALPELVPGLGGPPERVLVVAGGWGSSVLPSIPDLVEAGVVVEYTAAPSPNPDGGMTLRMAAMVVNPAALVERTSGTPR